MEHEQSYARVTLSLDIIRKMTIGPLAGYHQILAVKQMIDLHDLITVKESKAMKVICNNPDVPVDQTNLCWIAAETLKKAYGISRNATIIIDKRIPLMGGLAGGSSNAAATLRALSRLWDLRLKRADQTRLGQQIGRDVPFFFFGGTAVDEETMAFPDPLMASSRFTYLLIQPPIGISTAQAYAQIDHSKVGKETHRTRRLIKALEIGDDDDVYRQMHNDFEISQFSFHPILQTIKNHLLGRGCPCILSGSGSTMIAICQDDAKTIQANLPWPSVIARTR